MRDTNIDVDHAFGFVTIATGHLDYTEMAVDMALSLRRFHRDPICLLADASARAHVMANYPEVFDVIVELTPRYRPRRTSKFALAELVPFERAVFIDADTIVLSGLETLKRQTVLKNFFMMGSFLPADSLKTHHNIPVKALARAFELDSFFTSHSAALGYQRGYARSFLADCYDVHVTHLYRAKWRLRGFVGDELAIRVTAARRGMNFMEHPFPVIWPNEMADLRPGRRPKPLCHFHCAIPADTLDWLMAEVACNRARAGLPAVSEAAWRRKAEKSVKGNRLRALRYKVSRLI